MSDGLTAQQLTLLSKKIKTQLQALTNQIDNLHEQAEPVVLDQQSVGRVSRIDAITQQQMAKAGERQAIVHIKQLQGALIKIVDGDYGWCEACGDTISFDRLLIQPEAINCVACQQLVESTD